MSVNKVILVGNLGADPEVKTLEGDRKVANLRLATNESYTDKSGQRVTNTEWHSLEIWGRQAAIAEQYLKKGSQIYVEGRIRTDNWQDQEGNQRYTTRIRVDSFKMLDRLEKGTATQNTPSSGPEVPAPPAQDDDLPF